MKCVVGTVCKVHRAEQSKKGEVSECMLCTRLRNICDNGWMPWSVATTCASTQHQEEQGKICGNSSSSSFVDRLDQTGILTVQNRLA